MLELNTIQQSLSPCMSTDPYSVQRNPTLPGLDGTRLGSCVKATENVIELQTNLLSPAGLVQENAVTHTNTTDTTFSYSCAENSEDAEAASIDTNCLQDNPVRSRPSRKMMTFAENVSVD